MKKYHAQFQLLMAAGGYNVGAYRVWPIRCRIGRPASDPVGARAVDILTALAVYARLAPGTPASPESIGALAFNHRTPSASTLSGHVATLRLALGDPGAIDAVAGGYRLNLTVTL